MFWFLSLKSPDCQRSAVTQCHPSPGPSLLRLHMTPPEISVDGGCVACSLLPVLVLLSQEEGWLCSHFCRNPSKRICLLLVRWPEPLCWGYRCVRQSLETIPPNLQMENCEECRFPRRKPGCCLTRRRGSRYQRGEGPREPRT